MKKTFIFVLVFLASCQSTSINTIGQPIKAFVISEQCLHVCWLGINPGVTSVKDAEALLQASNQIENKTIVRSEDGIQVLWTTGGVENLYTSVSLKLRDDTIQTIHFTNLSLRLDDFMVLLGEPYEISIHVEPADNRSIIYTLYYPASKTMIYSISGGPEGPKPGDFIDILSLNAEFDGIDLPVWRANDYENRQPWLGYGHNKDYLPGQEIPTEP